MQIYKKYTAGTYPFLEPYLIQLYHEIFLQDLEKIV